MSEPGTSYTAEITTPSGLMFSASIYVPPDAEHADQHESAEIVGMAVTRMLTNHERGVEFRAQERAEEAACNAVIQHQDGSTLSCVRTGDHAPHMTATGAKWYDPPPF